MKSTERGVTPASEYYIYTPSKTAEKLFFYPMQCGNFIYEPGYSLFRNSFDSFLLMFIRAGTMTLDYGGKQQEVQQNSFVLLDCYRPHGYSSSGGYECLWMHFDGPLARGYCEAITSRLGCVIAMEDAFPVLRKMDSILKVFSGNATVREAQLSKYITDILTEFMLTSPTNPQIHSYAEMTDRIITYINEYFAEDIPVSRLANMAGLSPYYFIRIFRQQTGYTPHDYIVSQRMAFARYLLQDTTRSIKEICFSTGFSSESVFCSAFKKRHGMTPQGYRASVGRTGT